MAMALHASQASNKYALALKHEKQICNLKDNAKNGEVLLYDTLTSRFGTDSYFNHEKWGAKREAARNAIRQDLEVLASSKKEAEVLVSILNELPQIEVEDAARLYALAMHQDIRSADFPSMQPQPATHGMTDEKDDASLDETGSQGDEDGGSKWKHVFAQVYFAGQLVLGGWLLYKLIEKGINSLEKYPVVKPSPPEPRSDATFFVPYDPDAESYRRFVENLKYLQKLRDYFAGIGPYPEWPKE